ncbi:MAG: hypothetical protein RLN88_04580 [Ekhidna sp.]|uniref:hypothetical protein n=1 Tax=Ekhidna sp. TaxID=2608089 RepID=UPI0032ED6239
MRYLTILLLLPLTLPAQTEDPNAKVKALGVPEEEIRNLCEAARGQLPAFYDWNIPAVMEIICDIEGKPYPDFPIKAEAHEWLAKIWDEKYSCVYCKITQSITGSLDMMALYHEEQNWVYALNMPEGVFNADINKIRVIVEGRLFKQKTHLPVDPISNIQLPTTCY